MSVRIEPAQPVFLMRVLAPHLLRNGGATTAHAGDVIEATERERATYLFWGKAADA